MAPAPDAGGGSPGWEWRTLGKLGARIEVPAGCAVDDTSSEAPGAPQASYSLYDASGSFSVMVRTATERDAASLEARKAELGWVSFTEEAAEAGGWRLRWEVPAARNQGKGAWGVDALVIVGGKSVRCGRSLASREAADAVDRTCRSLAAAQAAK